MRTSHLLSLALLTVIPFAQKRVEQTKQADFPAILTSAQEAWKAERYGACVSDLNKALALAMAQRSKLIVAALPAAPDGWTREVEDLSDQLRSNPMTAGVLAATGSQVTGHYRSDDGDASIDLTVNADSPMAQVLSMAISNPVMRQPDSELIEYGANKALLTTSDGQPTELQILLAQKHFCQVDVSGLDEDRLFKFLDQAAVDKLAEALSK